MKTRGGGVLEVCSWYEEEGKSCCWKSVDFICLWAKSSRAGKEASRTATVREGRRSSQKMRSPFTFTLKALGHPIMTMQFVFCIYRLQRVPYLWQALRAFLGSFHLRLVQNLFYDVRRLFFEAPPFVCPTPPANVNNDTSSMITSFH
jgi:hypothetical protein